MSPAGHAAGTDPPHGHAPRPVLRPGSSALRRSSPPAPACWTSPAATAATRASLPPAAPASSRSIATRRRWRRSPGRRASRRARSISRPGAGRCRTSASTPSSSPTTCTGRCSRSCSPRWRTTACCIYETFARGNEAYGRPSNPDFLLERGELLRLAARGLTVVAFEQGVVAAPEPGAVVQRLAAVGPGRPWPPALPGG